MKKSKLILFFVLILLLGAGIRWIYFTKQWSVWWDETVYMSMADAYDGNNYFFESFRPPLLPFSLFLWESIVGNSLFYSRIFILLVSIISIPIVYVMTKKITDDETALLTTAFLAINSFTILYSARVLTETFTVLFNLMSVTAFYTGYTKRSNGWLALSGVSIALAMMSKHLMAYLGLTVFIFFLLKHGLRTFRDRRFYTVLIAGFVVIFPWLLSNYLDFGNPFYPQLMNIGLSPPEGLLFYLQYLPVFLGLQGLLIPFAFVDFKKSKYSEFLKLNIIATAVALVVLHVVAHKEDRFLMVFTYSVIFFEAIGLINITNILKNKFGRSSIRKLFGKSSIRDHIGKVTPLVLAILFVATFLIFNSLPNQYEDLFYKCTDAIKMLPNETMSTTMSPYFSYFLKRHFDQLPWDAKDFTCKNLVNSGYNYTIYYSSGWYQPLEQQFLNQTQSCTNLLVNITQNQKCLIFKVNR